MTRIDARGAAFSGSRHAPDEELDRGANPVDGPTQTPSATDAVVPHANPVELSARGDHVVFVPRDGLACTEPVSSASSPQEGRHHSHVVGLLGVDLLAAVVSVVAAYGVRYGASPSTVIAPLPAIVVLPTLWVVFVALSGGLSEPSDGRMATAPWRAFLKLGGLIAIVSYAEDADLAREFLLIALPVMLALDLVARRTWRRWSRRQRSRRGAEGPRVGTVVAVGDAAAIRAFADAVRRDDTAGISLGGACLIHASADETAALAATGVPQVGDIGGVVASARAVGARTIAIVSPSQLGSDRLRWLAWQLEGTGMDLLVSPGLVETASHRLRLHSVAWMPLLRVEQPQFRGLRRAGKEVMDRVLAAMAAVAVLPLLVAIFLVVRVSTPGPVLFRQTRVGRHGKTFQILKFRTMHVDAESRTAELEGANLYPSGPLFKLRDDPRVTPIGRVLRRYSLDELPQLANVLLGHMSLVGPRPPLPSEVSQYEPEAQRRLLVKPGITGLWQVSGRNDLSWEESVRLDLRYVENWSPALDLKILWKTASAVLSRSGAY